MYRFQLVFQLLLSVLHLPFEGRELSSVLDHVNLVFHYFAELLQLLFKHQIIINILNSMVINMIRNGSGLLPLSFFIELHLFIILSFLLFLKFHSFFLQLVENHIP